MGCRSMGCRFVGYRSARLHWQNNIVITFCCRQSGDCGAWLVYSGDRLVCCTEVTTSSLQRVEIRNGECRCLWLLITRLATIWLIEIHNHVYRTQRGAVVPELSKWVIKNLKISKRPNFRFLGFLNLKTSSEKSEF